ncbi:MAG: acyl carrier protein [Deltaproteobacteria bacterium]|nr:acyl carrier protein [Deltaproteobacteria bacterium]MBN2673296.1 acyl carrier protein [Deltaproteobacteria bacterium]
MNDRESIFSEVQKMLCATFNLAPEEVTLDKNLFTDLDLDSLDAVDMASELSTKSGIKFTNDDLRQIRTVGDVVDAILNKQSDNS